MTCLFCEQESESEVCDLCAQVFSEQAAILAARHQIMDMDAHAALEAD